MAILGSGGDVSIKVDSGYNSQGIDGSLAGLKKLDENTSRTTARMRTQYGKVSKSIFNLKTALVSLGAFRLGSAVFTAAADIQEGFIGVAKTTGLAGKEMKAFENEIGSLSTTLKGVKIEELENIAKIAGQLGIKGRENLLKFTETVAKMSIATNLTAEQAATSFAQLSNILNEPISNIERMGSVINELSNNSNALSSDLVELARRMGGAAETISLTTPEVLALSATLRDVGISLEVGGSSFTQIFTKMLTETNKFAKASGLTMAQYAETLHKSPVAALEVLLKRLSELDKFKRAEAIKSLGLAGTRTAPTLLLLSNGLDKLKEELTRANVEWKKGTSLQIEYETASRGTRAQLERLRNELKLNAKVIGEELLPAVVTIVGETSKAVTAFVSFGKAIGETAAKISLFTQTGGIFGTALRTDLERIGDMRLQMIALTGAVKQNQEIINASSVSGNTAQFDRFTLANQKLKKEIFRLTIGIGLEERAYIKANAAIQKNSAAKKENGSATGDATDAAAKAAKVNNESQAKVFALSQKIFALSKAKSDLLAIEAQNLVLSGATTAQLQTYLDLRNTQIAVESAVTAEKNRQADADKAKLAAQTELFAQAQALNDLQRLKSENPIAQSSNNELVQLQATYDQKQAMLADHNALVLQAMINSGASLSAVQATFAAQERARDRQTAQLKMQYAAGAFGAAANFMQNLTVIAGKEGGAMFEIMKGFATAQAIIDTYAAANKALASAPPPFNYVLAAATVAAGLARVAQIQRTQPGATSGSTIGAGGTTNPGFTGGANGAGPPPIPVTQAQNTPPAIQIQIINPLGSEDWDKIYEENIAPAINRGLRRNV